MKLLQLLFDKQTLNEYSNKVINFKIAEWTKETNGTVNKDAMLSAIDKFDKIKSNIPNRIKNGTLSISPKFMPPNPDAPKRPGDKMIKQENPSDIMKYTWKDIEILFDSYGEKADKTSKEFYTVQDAELVNVSGVNKVFSSNGLYIYEGSSKDSCIKLNYAFKFKDSSSKIQTYNFCVGRKEDYANRYYKYRFGGELSSGALYRSFYYCVDSTQSAEKDEKDEFLNWYHFFVIHVFENGKFGVTDAVNEYGTGHELDGNAKGVSWDEIGKFILKYGGKSGQQAWSKIENLQDIFKYVAPPEEEEVENAAANGRFNLESFSKASNNTKNAYINKRASDLHFFTKEMFRICTKEQKNLAISEGFQPSLDDLKDDNGKVSQMLARRYATSKFKKNITSYEANPENLLLLLPLPFVPYLNEDEKEKYYELFENKQITFEYTLKYFGEGLAKDYINKQVKNLAYIPPTAIPYITDNKLKALYKIIYNLYKHWEYSSDSNLSDEELQALPEMPESYINPILFQYNDWKSLSSEERKVILEVSKKYGNKKVTTDVEKFIKYAIPYIITDKNNEYVLLPKNGPKDFTYENWILSDINGNAIKLINGELSEINNESIFNGFPYDIETSSKFIDIKDTKLVPLKNTNIKESKYNLLNYIDLFA